MQRVWGLAWLSERPKYSATRKDALAAASAQQPSLADGLRGKVPKLLQQGQGVTAVLRRLAETQACIKG